LTVINTGPYVCDVCSGRKILWDGSDRLFDEELQKIRQQEEEKEREMRQRDHLLNQYATKEPE
jgi:hypothetical protein